MSGLEVAGGVVVTPEQIEAVSKRVPKPYKCPDCGRFSRDGWEVSSSEFSAMWGAICIEHGDWGDNT